MPAFLSEDGGQGGVDVPRVFEDRPRRATDDLDLPDFLKHPQ